MDANVLHFQRPFAVIVVCPLDVGLTSQLLALRDDFPDGMVIVEDQVAARIPEVNQLKLLLQRFCSGVVSGVLFGREDASRLVAEEALRNRLDFLCVPAFEPKLLIDLGIPTAPRLFLLGSFS